MAACVLWSVRAALSAAVILASLVHRTAAQTAAEAPEQTPGQPMVQSPAPGETGGEMVLTRDALLASARARYPEILARLADQAAAAGRADAAQGAFDLFLESEAEGWLTGFYQGTSVANVGVKRRFRDRGGSIYGGYRLAEGLFPVYDDVNFTNNLGELKVGAVFALMRDRAIDSDRFAVSDLALAEKQAAIEILLTEVGIQRAALVGYWNWIASGEVVDVFRSLLKRAEDRQDALTRQFEQGAVAEIMLLENQRVVTNRQAQLARARQDFAIASNDLSLFWRDAAGGTLVPKPSQRPVSQP
ncbi:MAG: TolC family protein, partial [Pseudomonadota bacterium]